MVSTLILTRFGMHKFTQVPSLTRIYHEEREIYSLVQRMSRKAHLSGHVDVDARVRWTGDSLVSSVVNNPL